MQNNMKSWDEIIDYCSKFLNEKQIESIQMYIRVGEEILAFEEVVALIHDGFIPLSSDLKEWIIWYGSESEKLGNKLNPNWKKLKL